MPQLSISTGSFYPKTTKDALERASALGFSFIEITLQNAEIGYGFQKKVNMERFIHLAKHAKTLGLRVTSLHAPFMTPEQVFSSKVRSHILFSSLEIARIFGADELVIHPYHLFSSYEHALRALASPKMRLTDNVLEEIPEFLNLCEQHRVVLAFENIAHWVDSPLLNSPKNMEKLITAMKNRLMVDLDIYHSEIGDSTLEFLDCLTESIVSVHASDCTNLNTRTLPGQGKADWHKICQKIKQLPNLKRIVLEIEGNFSDKEILASADFLKESGLK